MYVSSDQRERTAAGAHQVELPAELRRFSSLGRIDYSDCFHVDPGAHPGRTALDWARAILEGAPSSFRRTAPRVWLALGLKHGPAGSDRFVLGWEIRRDEPDVALLSASSRVGMPAELLVRLDEDGMRFATLVQHRNPAVRVAWTAIIPVHQRIVARLVERAARP